MSLIIKTTTNIWEMEKGFDIILFIDKNDVYNRNYWKDECFRRINDKYPFQELFTTSIINVSGKSCALVYSVYGESICCLLLNGSRYQRKNESGNAKLYSHSKERMKKRADSTASDVETGLRTIRDRLVGYRYLAVQQQRRARPVMYDFELIFRTVFRGDSGELWLCGQRRQFPSPRERVRTANGFSYRHRFKVITKNNAIDRKPSKTIILPAVTTLAPKSAPVEVTKITAPIELLLSDDDCEMTTMQQPNIPMIKTIPENVWDLNTDVDIILFIDMDIMYMDDWEDEVVERVNDRYPFKNRLLEDIQIMPMSSGTVQIYRQNGVSIFCVFFSNRMTTLSDWMEDALIDIKRLLAGHIQLAIQQDLSLSEFQSNVYSIIKRIHTIHISGCGVMTTYKLTYFNLIARAEQIRFLLSYLNIDFEDVRFEREQWPAIKPTMPFGKVPVLEIDGKTFNQSTAICRYLAKKAGLAGDDEGESLLVDVAVDNIYEIRQDIMKYNYEPNEEIKSNLRLILNDSIPFYFDRFEKIVSENGGVLPWPDLYFVSILDHIKSVIDVDLVDGRPHLTALKHKVLAIPQIKSWIAKRPKSQ